MQQLPYVVVTNPNISEVYDLYYTAFDTFRKVPEIQSLEENDRFCETVGAMLKAHLAVIPKLAMGVLECNGVMDDAKLDKFMNTVLRSVRTLSDTWALRVCDPLLTRLFCLAHLSSRHRRAAPCPNRHFSRTLVLSRRPLL
jgi:hypothetical protein